MVGGMAFALLAARAASSRAGLQHEPNDLLVRAGPPRRHEAGRGADVGTVQVEADALGELLTVASPRQASAQAVQALAQS
jgi:hypothetical protein